MKRLKIFALATSLGIGLTATACGKKAETSPDAKADDKARAAKVDLPPPPPPPPNFPGASGALEALSRFVPAQANSLIALDVKALMASPLWPKIEAGANASSEARKLRKALTDCGSKLSELDAFLAAADEGDSAVLLLRGAGMGAEARVRCLSKGMASVRGKPTPKLRQVERKGVITLEPENNPELIAVLVDSETLALVSPAWVDHVAARVKGTPERFKNSELGKLTAHLAFDRPVWFAGEFPKRADQFVQGTPLDAATDVTGFVDMREGLQLRIEIGLENRAQAAAAMDKMRDVYTEQRPLLAMVSGLSDTTLNKVKMSSKEDRAAVSLALTFAEVEQIQQALSRVMGGGAAAPPAVAKDDAVAPAGGAKGASKKAGVAPAAKKKG